MSLSRDRFREREWKCSEKHYLIKRVSQKIATVNYSTEHLLFVKFVEELLHVGTKLSPLDKTVQLEQRLCIQYCMQVLKFLMLSRLFGHQPLYFEPALHLLQYVDKEPANNCLTVVSKFSRLIDQRCSQLMKQPRASVEMVHSHSRIAANIKSTSI